ncbi:MAG: hypothetical protein R6X02_08480 [Enhygromyxa sp.]
MGPYLVLLALAGLGLALGWRLTPAPSDRGVDDDALARLLQLAIAGIGLVVLALLMVPFFMTLGAIECTPEAERAGACLIGVKERGLFGGAAFACLLGAAFAFVLRKGVYEVVAPLRQEVPPPANEPALAPKLPPAEQAKGTSTLPKPGPPKAEPPKPGAKELEQPEPEQPEPPEPEPEPEPEEPAAKPGSHRRLEGPVFRAFVDDQTVDLEEAIATAARRLRSDRVAVVFSRSASKDANEALLELAREFDAYRYVLEGTAAATEGLKIGDTPNPHEADEIAGPDARHAMQLSLDLAGGLIETVFLLDTRVAFPEFVLGQLTVLQSVCIAHAHDEVSAACQIVLPGTNSGEREGELRDAEGGVNQRRPRAWLVERLVAALREQAPLAPSEPVES